ncbi:hypothetical protein EMPS_02382 [Entomortierella parvispora]|uniref:VWFA domain-containing protein n=1 Tax=Entomortierella parvispora TaxID=205924 RepID=A0A9P3H5B9_9FUNG|nr:hypothetical protein EMPS_02382 [Entomortierella parvispora]
MFGLSKSPSTKKSDPNSAGAPQPVSGSPTPVPGNSTPPSHPHVWFGASAVPAPHPAPGAFGAPPQPGNFGVPPPPQPFGGAPGGFRSFGGSSFGAPPSGFGAPSSGFGSTTKPPLQQGLNRANDKVFQNLKATYLAEFNFKGVQVEATPLLPSVLRGLQTQLPVLFQIKVGQRSNVGKAEEYTRTPFNICLVLDISGSMQGARLQGCKKAIMAIIEQLTVHDTLSLVTYATEVTTVFTDCKKDHSMFMLSAVENIQTKDMTNLHGGLKVGVESLKRSIQKEQAAHLPKMPVTKEGSDKNKTAAATPPKKAHRVFLFSDGHVNHGVKNPSMIMTDVKRWLTNTDIQISTFGIGDGYDEKLMTAIAEHANGDSFFIETEDDIEDLVSKALRGVSNMIAPEATFKFRGLGDAVIKDIPGYDLTKTPGEIKLLHLRTNGLIQFIVNLDIRVPGLDDFSEDDMEDVVDSKNILGYSLTLGGDHFVNLEDCKGLKGSVSINYTSDSSLVAEDKKNNDVVTYLTIQEAAKIDEQVVDHLANNRTAEAIQAKKKVVDMFGAVQSKDRWGFTAYMQSQSARVVQNLETTGNTRFVQQQQQQQQQQAQKRDLGYGLYE